MAVQAKVRCIAISTPYWDSTDNSRVVRFSPVYDPDTNSPNYGWSEATPSGYIELTITNRAAYDQFEVNREYIVTFDGVS